MPVLPPEAIYLPFEAGPHRMAMALTTVPERAWFELDSRYGDEMAERRRLLAHQRTDVFGALPMSDGARAETLSALVTNLTTYAPQWFIREGDLLHNALTRETWDPVDRFMAKVKPGHIASRLNWSVLDDPAMFQPTGKWREQRDTAIRADNAGERLYLRVERQTLRRLPLSGAVLFGIRVHSYPLARAITTSDAAARLAEAVRALPEPTAHYKILKVFGPALLAWLDARSH